MYDKMNFPKTFLQTHHQELRRSINVYFCIASTQTLVMQGYFKDGFNAVLPFPDAVKPAEGGKLFGALLSQCEMILAEGGIDVYLLLELAVFKLLLRGVDMVRFACLIVLRLTCAEEAKHGGCPGRFSVALGITILALPCAGLEPPWEDSEAKCSAYPSDKNTAGGV